jgi:hypothetical protein
MNDEELWDILSIEDRDDCTDPDRSRRRFIPDLSIVIILSDRTSDCGVACLKYFRAPEVLCLHSKGNH